MAVKTSGVNVLVSKLLLFCFLTMFVSVRLNSIRGLHS